MRLLVAGGDRVDAGKTTFSVGLCERLDAVGFKPRAGNDYWFDHDDYDRATAAGRLYGKDAKRLAAASPGDRPPEAINPVHRLWRPSPGTDTGLIGPANRQFVCDRVTLPGESAKATDSRAGDGPAAGDGGRTQSDAGPEGTTTAPHGAGLDAFVENAGADVPASARERLPLVDAATVDSVAALDEVMAAGHIPALSAVADRIRARERVVIESYGDVALPLADLSVDAVAVVEPGRVRIYDGRRYGRACEVAGGSPRDGRLEQPVPEVIDYLDPAAAVSLPALTADERADPAAVADAYDVAYDALVAAALETRE